jgi:uncharacterized delta-60 repeat protein
MKSSKNILTGRTHGFRRISFLLLAIFVIANYLTLAVVEASVSGELDPTFAGGRAITDFSGGNDSALSMAVQPDGKIVAAGLVRNSSGEDVFGLARYNTDGSLDSSFGVGGKVTTQFLGSAPSFPDFAYCVLIQSDGKIVAGGFTSITDRFTQDFAIARYNSDGSLDPTFGSGGKVTTDFGGSLDVVHGIAQQADGKLIVAGENYPNAIVARYNLDGTLDSSFGTGGKVITRLADKYLICVSMLLQPDGKIVWLGWIYGDDADVFMARYNPNGTLDSGFGTGGIVITDVSGHHDEAHGLAIQPDGKIVVVGNAFEVGVYLNESIVIRYNTDGTLDPTFGTGGKLELPSTFNGAYAAVAIQPDAKIVLGGWFFLVARLNPDGTLDSSFGNNGRSTQVLSGFISALALQPDGRIIATGGYFDGNTRTYDFSVGRFDVVTTNRPPVANAGPDRDAECSGNPTTVSLNGSGSSDPDNDTLTYEWREGTTWLGNGALLSARFAPGSHNVTLIVTDPSGAASQDTVVVRILDTSPPSISAPSAVTVSPGSSCNAYVSDATLGSATATDACSGAAVTVTRTGVPANNLFPIGTTIITYTATDATGNSSHATQQVTVVDNSAPSIVGAIIDHSALWPPNHRMVDVEVTYDVVDNCGEGGVTSSLTVTSNEPVTGTGDGDVGPDWEIIDAHHVRLRAERGASGTGRVYTITITCIDGNGNSSSKALTVSVPRNQSQSEGR